MQRCDPKRVKGEQVGGGEGVRSFIQKREKRIRRRNWSKKVPKALPFIPGGRGSHRQGKKRDHMIAQKEDFYREGGGGSSQS